MMGTASEADAIRPPASRNETFAPILIVGHPRSGTTLMATILNRHSQVAIPPETSFFLPAFRHRRSAAARDGSHQALLEYLRSIPESIGYSEESVATRFAEGPATPADLFRCLLEDHGAAQGKVRCGEKSPMHLLAVPDLLKVFPRARVVCLVRDGRDVARSCRAVPFYTWEPDWWLYQSWCRAAAAADRYARRYPDQFLISRFEALLENPVEEVRRVDDFVGLPFEPSQLEDHGGPVRRDGEWWKDRASRAPDRGRAYSWRRERDQRAVQYATGLMNVWLARFGYDTYRSPTVAGPHWRYPGYRALSWLHGLFGLSYRGTSVMVRTWRKLRRPRGDRPANAPEARRP